jgi:hypothetical protein
MPQRLCLQTVRISLLILALIILGGLFYWSYASDPLRFLTPPLHDPKATIGDVVKQDGHSVRHITLDGGMLGDIGIIISLPDPLPAKKLPVLMVLGGLGNGADNIGYIKDAGDNVIVGYDWPIPVHFPTGINFILQLPALYRSIMSIPGQVATSIGWLAERDWADNSRFSILGFSLGALAAPSIENLAEHDGHPIGWTIIAYGGAPLGDLFANNPHMKPAWMRMIMGPVLDVLLRPVEPTVNLPQLSGHFLVLEGRDDALIPQAARMNLRDAVPQPKDVVVFDGTHMGVGPDKMALLQEIIRTSRQWLSNAGAVNKL